MWDMINLSNFYCPKAKCLVKQVSFAPYIVNEEKMTSSLKIGILKRQIELPSGVSALSPLIIKRYLSALTLRVSFRSLSLTQCIKWWKIAFPKGHPSSSDTGQMNL